MDTNDIMINGQDFTILLAQAVKIFWGTKEYQLSKSGDSTNRGYKPYEWRLPSMAKSTSQKTPIARY